MRKLKILAVVCGISLVTGIIIVAIHIIFLEDAAHKDNIQTEKRTFRDQPVQKRRPLARHDIGSICRDIKEEPIQGSPIVSKDDIPIDELETPGHLERDHKAKGRQEAMSTIELQGEGWVGVFGVGGGGSGSYGSGEGSSIRGGSGAFGWRGGRRRPAVRFAATRPSSPQKETVWYRGEEYSAVYDNRLLDPVSNPLSTFSIDVDTASYSNIRRFIRDNRLPPKDAVRIEEMINYFSYDYPQPEGHHPFSIVTELSECPWDNAHLLAHIGIQGREVKMNLLPPANLVFLIDVSGSMKSSKKLPLLKSCFKLLADNLRTIDRVAIVTYRQTAQQVLASTSGGKKYRILEAVEGLEARGTTAGEYGLRLAYETASEYFIEGGNNRIILATDGDFNVGATNDNELVELIEKERTKGIFLSILGFGTGNIKDAKLEKIADRGNGHYAYIDSIREGRKVLVNELTSTLLTIAKDVKIQVEFNPLKVKAYRLIGYANRMLNKEDFNNDRKDAGELGAGHSVTALYEVIPKGLRIGFADVDALKYQNSSRMEYIHSDKTEYPGYTKEAYTSNEIMNIKLRYKSPESYTSRCIVNPVSDTVADFSQSSDNFRFSAAVAGLGLLLRDSEYKGNLACRDVIALAESAKGEDTEGRRNEFINLAKSCRTMDASYIQIPGYHILPSQAGIQTNPGNIKIINQKMYDWGVIYYMSYDNDLEPAGKVIINRIRKGVTGGNVIAAVQADFTDAGGMHRYIIDHSGISHTRVPCDNSADENQLMQYIKWFTEKYSCSRYMIVLLNHGDGVDHMCRDDNTGYRGKRWMSGKLLGEKLRSLKKRMSGTLELLFLQQCGRGSLTNLYSFRDTAEYILFSSRRIGSPNTYYTAFHHALSLNPGISGKSIAEIIVENDTDYTVYSCIRTSKLSELASRLNNAVNPLVNSAKPVRVPLLPAVYRADNGETFADAANFMVHAANSNFIDEKHVKVFTEWLRKELLAGVWFSKHAGPRTRSSCGISMYIPAGYNDIKKYESMDLFKTGGLEIFWLKTLVIRQMGNL